jgi:excisionase family DNA binding protein
MTICSMAVSRDSLLATSGLKPLAVTVPTARKITGLGNTTIWQLIKDGKLKTVSVGRRRLIVYASLEQLLSLETDSE